MNAFSDLPPIEPSKKANAFADLPPTEPERVNEPSLLTKAGEYVSGGGLLGAATAPENLKGVYEGLNYANDVRNTIGSSVLRGWGGVVDFPAVIHNLAAKGVNYGVGSDVIPEMTPATQRFEPIKDWYGKNTERAIPKGQNAAVDAAATFAEWGSGGPFKSDLYAGIGAAGGEALTNVSGVPWLEEIGGLFGGLKGGSGSTARTSDVVDSAAHKLIEGRLGGSNSAEQAELAQQTQQAIVNGLREQPAPVQQGEWITPEGGWGEKTTPISANPTPSMKNPNQTMAELTGNRALYGLENTVGGTENRTAGRGYAMYDAITANKKALSDDIVNEVTPQPLPSIPTRATSDAAEAQIAALRGEADVAEQAVLTADEVAVTAGKRFDQQPSVPKASVALHGEIKRLDSDKKAVAAELWKAFDAGPPMAMQAPVTKLMKDFKAKHSSLDAKGKPRASADRAAMDKKYGTEIALINSWKKNAASPKDVSAVIRDINHKRNVAKDSAGGAHHIDNMAGELTDQLKQMLSSVSPAHAKATEATAVRYAKATPENIKKVLKSPSKETLIDRLNYTGASGAALARKVLASEDPKLIATYHDGLRALGKQEGVDRAFMKDYAGYLSDPKFGRLKNEFTDIIAKQDLAAGAKDSAAKVTGLAKAAEASTLKKFAEKPEAVIDGMLKNGKANSKELKSLLASAVDNGTEKSFKNLMTERIKGKLFGDIAFPEATGGRSGSAVSFGRMRDTLVEAGIYTPKEADRIAGSLDRVKALDLRKEATNAQLQQTLNAVEGLTVSAAAVLTAKATGQSSLTMVGALRKAFKARALVKKNNTDVIKRVEEFLISPEKYLDGVKASKTLDENVNTIATHVMGASIAADSDGKDEQEQR